MRMKRWEGEARLLVPPPGLLPARVPLPIGMRENKTWRLLAAKGLRERFYLIEIPYSAFSIASALDTSTWLGTCSTLSAFTVPSSTSIE